MEITSVPLLFSGLIFTLNEICVLSQATARKSLPPPSTNFTSGFYLFTKQNVNAVEKITKTNLGQHFISGAKTIFIIHGFTETGRDSWVHKMKNELLMREELNVVIVQWEEGAAMFYPQAASNTRTMGRRVADMVEAMNEMEGISFSNIHLIGHGLGAHVAGFAGKILKFRGFTEKLGRITALDPSGPGFALEDDNDHLEMGDAEFVDVIHSNDGELYNLALGYLSGRTVGHADFYPNGGKVQPTCPEPDVRDLLGNSKGLPVNIGCSHLKSAEYFTNSIKTCQYRSRQCTNGKVIPGAVMGYHASTRRFNGPWDEKRGVNFQKDPGHVSVGGRGVHQQTCGDLDLLFIAKMEFNM